jgi:hypothetical protein
MTYEISCTGSFVLKDLWKKAVMYEYRQRQKLDSDTTVVGEWMNVKVQCVCFAKQHDFVESMECKRTRHEICWSHDGDYAHFCISVCGAMSFLMWVRLFKKIHYLLNFRTVWPCIVIDPLWIKPTDAPSSIFIGITTLHVSGSPSAHHQESLAVRRHWYNLCSLVTESVSAHNRCRTNVDWSKI